MKQIYDFVQRHRETLTDLREQFDIDSVAVVFSSETGGEKRIEVPADSLNTNFIKVNLPANTNRITIEYGDSAAVYKRINCTLSPSDFSEGVQSPVLPTLNGLGQIEAIQVRHQLELQGVMFQMDKRDYERRITELEKSLSTMTAEKSDLEQKNKKLRKKLKEKESVEWYADVAVKGAPLGKVVAALFPKDSQIHKALDGLGSTPPPEGDKKPDELKNEHAKAVVQALRDLEAHGRDEDIASIFNLVNEYFNKNI